MPWPARTRSARRDLMLARTRRISLIITGAAAAASLGLGTAFAHALPGHRAPSAPSAARADTGHAGTGAADPVPASPAARAASKTHASRPRHGSRHRLRPPAQAPVAQPSPPQVVSGGS